MNGTNGTLRKRFFYDYTELDAVRGFLEKMSREGWMLQALKGRRFTFTACEARERRFNVEVVPTAENMDSAVNQKTQEYLALCRDAGWENVAHTGSIFVFMTEDADVPDVVTDMEEKIAVVRKTAKDSLKFTVLSFIPGISSVFLLISNFFMMHEGFSLRGYFRAPSDFAGFGFCIFLPLVWLSLILVMAGRSRSLRAWVRSAENALAVGAPLPLVGEERRAKRKRQNIGWIAGLSILTLAFALWGALAEKIWLPLFSLVVAGLIVIAAVASDRALARKEYPKKKYITMLIVCSLVIAMVIVGLIVLLCFLVSN